MLASSRPAISIRGLGKQYSNRTERDRPWALRDVSFDVQPGEVVALIGRNGAGKSTLLKILAGVTDKSEGELLIAGRVGSLLELGTGLDPALTTRDNIFLSGTVLGATRAEIREQFDQIVEFSGVDHVLDTPLNEYGAGPLVRMTLAIAVHLRCDILLVDDILALSDETFRWECFGRMRDIAASGRAVVLVSHHQPAVSRFCSRAAWLELGRLAFIGAADEAVGHEIDSRVEQSLDHGVDE
jgi:lipopolysaccharide transport system ATP-binding protein